MQIAAFTTAQGLAGNSIACIYEDREGTLWLGTRDNGLMRVTRRIITSYTEKDGLSGKVLYPVLEDRAGNIWIGNRGRCRLSRKRRTSSAPCTKTARAACCWVPAAE